MFCVDGEFVLWLAFCTGENCALFPMSEANDFCLSAFWFRFHGIVVSVACAAQQPCSSLQQSIAIQHVVLVDHLCSADQCQVAQLETAIALQNTEIQVLSQQLDAKAGHSARESTALRVLDL